MKSITIEELTESINSYDPTMISDVLKAYQYAKNSHSGQIRESGEEYITHPLTVAYILSEMKADRETICAALLHDTLEDTKLEKEDIVREFGKTVAELVDGVTKLSKVEFTNKQDRNHANTRKIITSLTNDVRVILIKLADRLHNMRTLSFKKENKQKDISIETMEIFVPLAYNIGAYQIKTELEDLSLSYLKPQEYKKTKEETDLLLMKSEEFLKEMLNNISSLLNDKNVPNEIKIRVRNIYGIYRRRCEGQEMRNIHDLLALKVIVNEVASCYLSLGYIHSLYKPINSKFKDYICNPKTNMYQCLHTTVFGPEDMLVQAQIRTPEMYMIDSYGIAAYWNLKKENASDVMQEVVENKCQFFKSLVEIDEQYADNRKFVEQVKKELLGGNVYVYTTDGVVLQLPVGFTPVDFAYMIDPMNASKFVAAYVNDRKVADDYILQNKDRVRILTSKKSLPKEEWKDSVQTTRALTLIKKDL